MRHILTDFYWPLITFIRNYIFCNSRQSRLLNKYNSKKRQTETISAQCAASYNQIINNFMI